MKKDIKKVNVYNVMNDPVNCPNWVDGFCTCKYEDGCWRDESDRILNEREVESIEVLEVGDTWYNLLGAIQFNLDGDDLEKDTERLYKMSSGELRDYLKEKYSEDAYECYEHSWSSYDEGGNFGEICDSGTNRDVYFADGCIFADFLIKNTIDEKGCIKQEWLW